MLGVLELMYLLSKQKSIFQLTNKMNSNTKTSISRIIKFKSVTCPSTPSKIGLDRLACQQSSVSSTAHGIMPFCDFMAFSHFDIVMILGLVPNVYYSLLAILLHTGRYICNRWCDGSRYLIPSASLPVYLVQSSSIGYLGNQK